jgi:hypothetical protein
MATKNFIFLFERTFKILSSLYVCMAIKYIIVLFVETPRKFAVINLRGVSTNKTIIYLIAMQTYKELKT